MVVAVPRLEPHISVLSFKTCVLAVCANAGVFSPLLVCLKLQRLQ